jgi:excinuclease UvrABC ATPase subunit
MSIATGTSTGAGAQSPALHVADRHELIRVQGARENNLADVSIEIPKRRLTVFTGVSGFGKSSLVFATIAAESQRMGGDARSTVGTVTDAGVPLRILFSRLGRPHIADACAMQISDLAGWVRELAEPSVAPLLAALHHTFDSFVEIGLGYLGLALLDRLVDAGKSVIVVEHHQAVMAHADWIIDLGPGAGHDGGQIVFEGTPADLVAARSTRTGEHLAAYVGA